MSYKISITKNQLIVRKLCLFLYFLFNKIPLEMS